MPYILAEIDSGGYIRSEARDFGGKKIVHKESISIDQWEGVRVFDKLATAKVYWNGASSDEAVIKLRDDGGVENIWVAEKQHERLTARLKRWSGCYGSWPIRRLND